MKYVLNIKEAKGLVDSMSLIDEGSQAEVLLGVNIIKESQVMCGLRVTGRTDQIMTRFSAVVDEDVIEPESFVVSVKEFAGVLSGMASYNKDIVIDTASASAVSLSVPGEKNTSAQVYVNKISGGCETPEIPMNSKELLLQVVCKTEKFKAFAQRGCMFADAAKGNGCENVILKLNMKTSQMTGYSSDSFVIGWTNGNVSVNETQNAQFKEALAKYLSRKEGESEENIILLIPEKSFSKLLKVVDGCEQFGLAADPRHLFVGAGKNAYTLTLGAQRLNLEGPIAAFETGEAVSILKMAPKELLKGVQLLKKTGTIKNGGDKVCLHVTISDNDLCLSAEKDAVQIPLTDVTVKQGEEIDFYCYSNLIEKAVSSITDDCMTMTILQGKGPVKMTGKNVGENIIYMLKSRKPVSEEEETTEVSE